MGMAFRAIDADGDWNFGKGLEDIATDEQAIEMNLATLIRCWVGDCFFDVTTGVDYKNFMDIGQKQNLINNLSGVILNAYGIVGILSLTADFTGDTRQLNVQYNVATLYSTSFTDQILMATGSFLGS
jgi:hypothetical protein